MNAVLEAAPLEVLCVDDNELDIERVERLLGRLDESVALRRAFDGVDALERLQDMIASGSVPDAILLDLNMPRLDGHACLEAIRAERALASVFVAIVSTSMRESDRAAAEALGADAYLTKAVTPEELAGTLTRARARLGGRSG